MQPALRLAATAMTEWRRQNSDQPDYRDTVTLDAENLVLANIVAQMLADNVSIRMGNAAHDAPNDRVAGIKLALEEAIRESAP